MLICIDNFIPHGQGVRNLPEPKTINPIDETVVTVDGHAYHQVVAEEGVFRRSINYTKFSPYGWEIVTEV